MRCQVESEEDVFPENAAALRKANLMRDEQVAPKKLVGVRRDQGVRVLAIHNVGHVGRVDVLRPSRLVGTGLLAVEHIGVATRGHGISGLECTRVQLVVVIHEQYVLALRQSETHVSWPAWPAR